MIAERADAFRLRLEIGDDPVPQDGRRKGFHVLHRGHVAVVHDGPRLGGEDEILGSPRAGTPFDPFLHEGQSLVALGTGGAGEEHRVAYDVGGDRDPPDQLLHPDDPLRVDHFFEDGLMRRRRGRHDLHLLIEGRVVDVHVEHEPVELGLRQWVRAFLLYGILRCQDKKGLSRGYVVPPAVTLYSCMA